MGEACQNSIVGQLRKVGEDLCFRHATRQVTENITNRDSSASHARFSKTDVWADADVGIERHEDMVILSAVAIQLEVKRVQVAERKDGPDLR